MVIFLVYGRIVRILLGMYGGDIMVDGCSSSSSRQYIVYSIYYIINSIEECIYII